MPNGHGMGERAHYKDFSTRGKFIFWAVMVFVVMPCLGFGFGMLGTVVFPPMAKLATPVVCSNGTLQSRQFTDSTSYSTSYSARFDCVVSQTGTDYNVTTPVLYVNGLILAVAAALVLGLVLILMGAIRYWLGRSATA